MRISIIHTEHNDCCRIESVFCKASTFRFEYVQKLWNNVAKMVRNVRYIHLMVATGA